MTSCSAYKLGGKLAGDGQLLGDRLGISQVVVSNYFSFALLVFLEFYFSPSLLFSFLLQFILFQLLNCSYLNP